MIMDRPTDFQGDGVQSGSTSTTRPVPLEKEKNAWDSYDTVFLNAKAGMDNVDKKKVQKVVYDMSKGSKYFNNEQRKEAEVLQRVQRMNARAASLTPEELVEHEKATDLAMAELEATRDLSHIWVHVDMDAFYAAVETLVNPSLAGKPMAVGGMSMICTANYEARKFGVRAAMPGFIARKLCPNLIFVRPDFKKYAHYSDLSRQVFKEYDPDFVSRSMDEAYLNISKACQLRNMSGAEVAKELRSKVHSATGLTCSAGVGPNRLLAKVCSDINKPNGQFVLGHQRDALMAFVSSLPIRKINGIGKVTERLLKEVLGISTCADLLTKRAYISALFSQISTEFFLAVGLGIGGSETPQKEPRKSLSNERTFAAISEEHQLFQKLEELVELLADDMQKEDLQGRTLTLKLKETGFEVRSRGITLPSFISTTSEIWEHAYKLLKGELPLSLRLMGLRMSNFKEENSDTTQKTLASFITRSSGAKRDQNAPVSSSSNSHDIGTAPIEGKEQYSECSCQFLCHEHCSYSSHVIEAPIERKEQCSGGRSHEKNAEEFSDDKRGLPGSKVLQTIESPQKDMSRGQQTSHKDSSPRTPSSFRTISMVKAPGPVQTKLEDLMPSHGGFIARTQRGSYKESSAQLTAPKGKNSKVDTGSSLGIDAEEALSRSRVESPEDLDPSSREGDMSAGFPREAGLSRDPTMSVETSEPSWEALQSGYDSAHEQVWKDNRCALCGIEVSDCLPSARQEHEDFHFAMWLQQQGEESGGLQKSSTTTTVQTKKASRTVVERESNKRKGSGAKLTSPHKRGSSRPIDAFFSRAK